MDVPFAELEMLALGGTQHAVALNVPEASVGAMLRSAVDSSCSLKRGVRRSESHHVSRWIDELLTQVTEDINAAQPGRVRSWKALLSLMSARS